MRFVLNDKQKLLGQTAIDKAESKVVSLFSKFGRNVKSIEFTVDDVNGPRGGIDKECRVVVKLRQMPDVAARAKDVSMSKSLSAAVNRAARSVGRMLDRRNSRDDNRLARELFRAY